MTERYKNRQKCPFFLHFFVSATEFPLFDQNRKTRLVLLTICYFPLLCSFSQELPCRLLSFQTLEKQPQRSRTILKICLLMIYYYLCSDTKVNYRIQKLIFLLLMQDFLCHRVLMKKDY